MSARPKKLHDDGTTVTVDLHGCTVDEGLHITRRVLEHAHRRGRAKVDLIHGSSTTDRFGYTRTLKTAIRKAMDAGEYVQWVSGSQTSFDEGRTIMALKIGPTRNPDRITQNDL